MQVMYRPYRRASTVYRYSLSVFDNAHIDTFDAFANKLLSNVHLKYFCVFIHIDVIENSLDLSCRVCM